MKILHVYKDFDPPIRGGMERHIALMCRFQRQWAEVEALVCSRSFFSHVTERDGTRVFGVGEFGRFQSAPVSPLFPYFMRRIRADVVVVHVPNPTAEMGYLLGRPRGRLIVRYHSDVVRQAAAMRFYGPIQLRFLHRAAAVIPTSQQYVDTSPTLQAFLNGLDPRDRERRLRVIPLGIIPDEFQHPNAVQVAAAHAKYGPRFALFTGRHRYYKGLEYLIRAARHIDMPVVIAGEGPESQSLHGLAKALGVPVFFPGELSQEELVAHLNACTVFVFPSVERSEAFGVSVLEAHACAKPVVATRLGTGVEFANLDGRTGYNVPPRDPMALAEAVNRLARDDAMREQMGLCARKRVEVEFHAERAARAAFEVYQEVLR